MFDSVRTLGLKDILGSTFGKIIILYVVPHIYVGEVVVYVLYDSFALDVCVRD